MHKLSKNESVSRLLLSLVLFAAAPLQAQMLAAGQFQVSESGATTYTIPVQVSPGIGGMEPKLSLNYSSQSGNGPLGVGWSLGGLGGVSRCPKTIAQDGVKGGINYDGNDRFCLDGQRLIAISGSEGADGTEYRTERESFAKIVSYGSAGNGPAWFKVWTKAGQVMEYGRTADARIEAQGKTSTRLWALNRIEDTKSNYLTASYVKDAGNGDYYASRIDYTGNSKSNAVPVNSVQFEYESRPDIVPAYQSGSIIKNVVRLKSVSSYAGSNLLKKSSLTYVVNPQTFRSQLQAYTECSADINSCLPPIRMEFTDNTSGFAPAQGVRLFAPTDFGTPDLWSKSIADLNGDGIADLIWMYSGPNGLWAYTSMGKSDGTFSAAQALQLFGASDFGASSLWSKQIGDINGDGISDLIWMYSGPSGLWAYTALGKGDGTFFPAQGVRLYAPSDFGTPELWSKMAVDLNGDGITDLAWVSSGPSGLWAYTAMGKGDGTFLPAQGARLYAPSDFGTPDLWSKQIGDVNGDGIADLIWMYSGPSGLWAYTAVGKGDGTFFPAQGVRLFAPTDFGTSDLWSKMAVDLNGDGITDLAWVYSGPAGLWVYSAIGKGDGTFMPAQANQVFGASDFGASYLWSKQATDVNGDGITDMIWTYSGPSGLWAYTALGKGDGTFSTAQGVRLYEPTDFGTPDLWSKQTADLGGDGVTDLAWMYSGPSGLWIYSSKNKMSKPELVSRFNAGLTQTQINYAPLTNGDMYTKDKGALASQYPLVDIQSPLYVASSVVSSNGVGSTTTANYTYGGLKSDQKGRGLLGFRWMQAKQVETGLISYTEYQQTWPYTGLPSLVKKSLTGGGNSGVLSQVNNSYNCNDAANTTATPCVVGIGKRYFVYADQSVESGWDYNGASLPVITTKTEYDNWGNATKVNVNTSDGYGKTTVNNYSNDSSNWYLGRLLKSSVSSVAP